ncbi:hypothetical protein AB4Z45_20755 [Paenibacillus sp. MCAF9]
MRVAAKLQPTPIIKPQVKPQMTKEDANKIIEFLKAGFGIVVDPASS